MQILAVEPYHTGSHAAWLEGYARHSRHQVECLTLPGRFWKWRMHGGAVTLARQFFETGLKPDLILATDMLDLTTFLALTRQHTANIPTAVYFHENQLSYPWSPTDRDKAQKRDKHYGFINYVTALAADVVLFNSAYHRESFLAALPQLLKHFPDFNEIDTVTEIDSKSRVLPLGLDLTRFDAYAEPATDVTPPIILWNHRWEYDKNPTEFFEALYTLAERDIPFQVAILGEKFQRQPRIFLRARQRLADRIVQFGYCDDFATYARWLWQANLLPVTSHQDFFGASVIQALYCDCVPLLPRRLAYPELIPAELHHRYFYDNFDDLVVKLTEALRGPKQKSLRPIAANFDWHRLAPKYDDLLQEVGQR